MPLFPNLESDYMFKGKSHTHLVVSEGAAPAEKWIVSKDESVKFQYPYGPENNQSVVLAKGKIVTLGEAEFDYETSRKVSTIRTAEAGSKNAVGVNHHNIYERRRDRFSGNNQPNPVVITRSYIEVPFFEHAALGTAEAYASAMKFGAAYSESGNQLQPGDFVKVGSDGNFVKLDTETDSPFQIIGQVLAAERELPPAGFLQYYMDMNIPELEQFFKTKSHAPSPGKPGGDFDGAGAYPYGYPWANKGWKGNFEDLLNPAINKGIPFLTDGYFKAKQTVTGIQLTDVFNATTNTDGHVENVVVSGQVTITGNDVVVAPESRNNAVFVKLRHPIDKAETDRVAVKFDGGTISDKDLHIDFTNNMVVIYLEEGKTYANVTIDAKLVVDPVAGVPTEWDYAGSVGAVRILLQR